MSRDADAAVDRECRYDKWQQQQFWEMDQQRQDQEEEPESPQVSDAETDTPADVGPRTEGQGSRVGDLCLPCDPQCNPDRFSMLGNERRQRRLGPCVKQAELVHINYMHIRLDIHYQEEQRRQWRIASAQGAKATAQGKRKQCKSNDHKTLASVMDCHIREKVQHLALPSEVKDIFRQPGDEKDWSKLEQFRQVLARRLQRETVVDFQKHDVLQKFERWLEGDVATDEPDVTHEVFQIKEQAIYVRRGATIALPGKRRAPKSFLRQQRSRGISEVPLRLRPVGSALMPPILNEFGQAMMEKTVKKLAALYDDSAMTAEAVFNQLLLVLWSDLFFTQCEEWRAQDKANLPSTRVPHLATWFLRGQAVAQKAFCKGICCRCGALLRGGQGQKSALSNMMTCAPIDADDEELPIQDGVPQTDAQPPFLLRYSRQLFAEEQSSIFAYDAETNRLSLCPGVPCPWVAPERKGGKRRKDDVRTWLCCGDCKGTLDVKKRGATSQSGKRREHIPFRDQASMAKMKERLRSEAVEGSEPMRDGEALADALEYAFFENAGDAKTSDVDSAESANDAGDPDGDHTKQVGEGRVTDDDEEELEESFGAKDAQSVVDGLHQGWPSLKAYRRKWHLEEQKHLKIVPGEFSVDNLVPAPRPELWQDAPHVPFDVLQSKEALGRLSLCRPIDEITEAQPGDYKAQYPHNVGPVSFKKRGPWQLMETFGFMVNRQGKRGEHMHLKPEELCATHECLNWMRDGHNKLATAFYSQYETFAHTCSAFHAKLASVLPDAPAKMKVWFTAKRTCTSKGGTIEDTLQQHDIGLVIVDGHPISYDGIEALQKLNASQDYGVTVHTANQDCKNMFTANQDRQTWRPRGEVLNTDGDDKLTQEWRESMAAGAAHVSKETHVPANHPHYDAMMWPNVHPYGSGSLLAEEGSGGTQRHARNRLALIQSWFRREPRWIFWMRHRVELTALRFKQKRREKQGQGNDNKEQHGDDPIARYFGTEAPADRPESKEWWHRRQRDVLAMTDDAELGLMQTMVTLSHNDNCAEMLAAIRGGLFAEPTAEEQLEYLLGRKAKGSKRPDWEHFAYEHVLSFQRRVHAMKERFMPRHKKSPLGIIEDFWDRTEAQMRGALHAHILCWFRLSWDLPANYKSVPPVKRTSDKQQQRPKDCRCMNKELETLNARLKGV